MYSKSIHCSLCGVSFAWRSKSHTSRRCDLSALTWWSLDSTRISCKLTLKLSCLTDRRLITPLFYIIEHLWLTQLVSRTANNLMFVYICCPQICAMLEDLSHIHPCNNVKLLSALAPVVRVNSRVRDSLILVLRKCCSSRYFMWSSAVLFTSGRVSLQGTTMV